ncbi:MAG: heme-binding protein [bacterium]|nr:heme-binding protein [bacterium]
MSTKRMFWIGFAVIAVAIVYVGWRFTSRTGYESAAYKVVESDNSFEIREYPELTLAVTDTQLNANGNDGSFMRLFGYISGENGAKEKIAMTTPVFMSHTDEGEVAQMGFVLPAEVAESGAPSPTENAVRVQSRLGGRFAVIRFAGTINEQTVQKAESDLRNWIQSKGLEHIGLAERAGYDPPWTPGPFRRNEILIRIQ